MVAGRTPDTETENREANEGSVSGGHSDDDDDNDDDDGDDKDDSDSNSDADTVGTTSAEIDQGVVSQRIRASRTRERGAHSHNRV